MYIIGVCCIAYFLGDEITGVFEGGGGDFVLLLGLLLFFESPFPGPTTN